MNKLDIIEKTISNFYKIDIKEKNRNYKYIKARFIYYKISKELTDYNCNKIAKHIDRINGTMLNALNKEGQFKSKEFKKDYLFIKNNIESKIYDVFELNKKLIDLKKELKELKDLKMTKYEAINELLSLDHSDILECIKYKIEPHLKMLKSKVTNKYLIEFQKQTRKM